MIKGTKVDFTIHGIFLSGYLVFSILIIWLLGFQLKIIYLTVLLFILVIALIYLKLKFYSPLFLVLLWYFFAFWLEPLSTMYVELNKGLHVATLNELDKYKEAYLSVIVSLSCIFLGYLSPIGKYFGYKVNIRRDEWNGDYRGIILFLFFTSVAAWLLYMFLMGTNIKEMYLRSHSIRMKTAGEAFASRILSLANWLTWAGIWIVFIRFSLRKNTRKWDWIKLLLVFILLEIWMLSLSSRYFLFLPLFSALIILSMTGKWNLSLTKFIILGIIGIFFSHFVVVFRTLSYSQVLSLSEIFDYYYRQEGNLFSEAVTTTLSRIVYMQMVFDNIPASTNFTYGASYLGALMALIPQRFVNWKPDHTDTFLAKNVLPHEYIDSGGFAFGGVSESYANFGWTGIIVMYIIGGIILRTVDVILKREKNRPNIIFYYVSIGLFVPGWVYGGYHGVGMIDFYLSYFLSWCLVRHMRSSI